MQQKILENVAVTAPRFPQMKVPIKDADHSTKAQTFKISGCKGHRFLYPTLLNSVSTFMVKKYLPKTVLFTQFVKKKKSRITKKKKKKNVNRVKVSRVEQNGRKQNDNKREIFGMGS